MLILTRRVGQSIMIGEDITIKITAVDGRGQPTVRVGIVAPKHMRVDREEVRAAINREKTPA